MEDNVTIQHHVTIGIRNDMKTTTIYKNVYICAYELILEYIEIGENAVIGAGAIVLYDIGPHSTCVNPVELK
ncbi:serine acetyltransferase [Clostridium pascui]|nr:serine acetyltransferase [Clostridium pascui]